MNLWIVSALPLAAAVAGISLARRRYLVVTVTGTSMTPDYHPGDRLLVRRGPVRQVGAGGVVVMRLPRAHPFAARTAGRPAGAGNEFVIKRVAAVPGDSVPASVRGAVQGASVVPVDMFVVLADNPIAADSRAWGFVDGKQIIGTVVFKLSGQAGCRPIGF